MYTSIFKSNSYQKQFKDLGLEYPIFIPKDNKTFHMWKIDKKDLDNVINKINSSNFAVVTNSDIDYIDLISGSKDETYCIDGDLKQSAKPLYRYNGPVKNFNKEVGTIDLTTQASSKEKALVNILQQYLKGKGLIPSAAKTYSLDPKYLSLYEINKQTQRCPDCQALLMDNGECPLCNYIEEEPLEESIEKHDTLNPKIFNEDNKLRSEVRDKLIEIVDAFTASLLKNGIKFFIKDIRLVGSNCSFNYTKDSDIDLHILVEDIECEDDLYNLLYSAYRTIWNDSHDIMIYDIPLELYVETPETTPHSNGLYSVFKDEWLKFPKVEEIPEIDMKKINSEVAIWEKKYYEAVNSKSSEEMKKFITELYDFRKASIQKDGEYSDGNLVFKELRNLGYLDSAKELRYQYESVELSL